MALSVYAILFSPYVALIEQQSVQGFTFADRTSAFGLVDTINYACITVQEGKSCLFKKTDAFAVVVGNQEYFIVKEGDLILQENEAL